MFTAETFSWAAGFLVVTLFGWNKFHEESPGFKDSYKNRVLSQIYLKDLTVHYAFSRALVIYIVILLFIFVTVVLVGRGLGITGQDKISPAAWPMFCALLIVGLLPNLPWISQVELWLRGMMHARAMILRAVEELYSSLTGSKQEWKDLSETRKKEIFPLAEIETKFVEGELARETTKWIKTGILINTIDQVMATSNISDRVGNAFIEKYRPIWDRVFEDFGGIRDQLGLETVSSAAEMEKRILKSRLLVNKVFDDAFSFVSCVIVNRPARIQTSEALQALHFELSPKDVEEGQERSVLEHQADSLLYSFFGALLAVIVVYALLSAAHPLVVKQFPEWYKQWPMLAYIGGNLMSVVGDYGWVGIGMFAFFLFRKKRVAQGNWYRTGTKSVMARNYLAAGALVLVVASVTRLLLDGALILGIDDLCGVNSTTAAAGGGCYDLLVQKSTIFVNRNWLKILFCVAASVVVFLFIENSGPRVAKRRRMALFSGALVTIIFLDIIGKYNLAAQAQAALSTSNPTQPGNLDPSYMIVVAFCSVTFWTVFMLLRVGGDTDRQQSVG